MLAKYLYIEDDLDTSHVGQPWLRGKKLSTMEEVWSALEKLDGARFSFFIVAEGPPTPKSEVPFSGKAMSISGGKNSQYLCEAFVNDDYSPSTVRNPDVPVSYDDLVPLKRGVVEYFPRHQIVGRKAVRQALTTFVKEGALSDRLLWEEEKEQKKGF